MTTQDCADHLNGVAGAKLFDDREMRRAVERLELACLNPHKGHRRRFKITPLAFCHYVERHHPDLVAGVKQRLGFPEMFHEERT